MNLREVVIGKVDRHSVSMVLDLLGEAIGQPGEAAHVHPHGEILSLNDGRGDESRIGHSRYIDLVRAGESGRAVADGGGSLPSVVGP